MRRWGIIAAGVLTLALTASAQASTLTTRQAKAAIRHYAPTTPRSTPVIFHRCWHPHPSRVACDVAFSDNTDFTQNGRPVWVTYSHVHVAARLASKTIYCSFRELGGFAWERCGTVHH